MANGKAVLEEARGSSHMFSNTGTGLLQHADGRAAVVRIVAEQGAGSCALYDHTDASRCGYGYRNRQDHIYVFRSSLSRHMSCQAIQERISYPDVGFREVIGVPYVARMFGVLLVATIYR